MTKFGNTEKLNPMLYMSLICVASFNPKHRDVYNYVKIKIDFKVEF